MGCELAYYDSAFQCFNHYTTKTHPIVLVPSKAFCSFLQVAKFSTTGKVFFLLQSLLQPARSSSSGKFRSLVFLCSEQTQCPNFIWKKSLDLKTSKWSANQRSFHVRCHWSANDKLVSIHKDRKKGEQIPSTSF